MIDAAAFGFEFSRLVLTAGLATLVVNAIVGWARRATKADGGEVDD